MPVFLEYFNGMKQMFDEFYNFPLPVDSSSNTSTPLQQEMKSIQCFREGETFNNVEGILTNVDASRLVGNAIEVKSAFGE
jgi:hypothetical protein